MAVIEFYEKPGCVGNARQKQLLEKAGHSLMVHDLLSETWTAALLRGYFGARPVAQWFNASAPAIKAGELVPEALAAEEALELMLADPLLIRRPLMRLGDQRWVGFDDEALRALLSGAPDEDLERCPRESGLCTPD